MEDARAAKEFVQDLYETEDVTVYRVDLTDLAVTLGWDGPGTLAYVGNIDPRRLRRCPDL
jgi:hypothetical protein